MTVPQAIAELRKALEETQQGFANKLGISISGIYKYENGRVPEPGVLLRLKQLAEDKDLQELAIIFRDQWYKDMGVPDSDSWKGVMPLEPRTPNERLQVGALLRSLRNRSLSHTLPAIYDSLSEGRKQVKEILEEHRLRREKVRANRDFVKHVIDAGAGWWDKENKRLKFYREGDEIRSPSESQLPAEKLSPQAR